MIRPSATLSASRQTIAVPPTYAFPPSGAYGISSIFSIVQKYMDRLLPIDHTMKVLLVDKATLNIISMSCTQSFLLHRGVFLVDRVPGHRQRHEMKAMRCIIFIRPDSETVDAACTELQAAKYSSYSIAFCGVASLEYLDRLAHADEGSLVTHVDEFFCDFDAVNHDAFLIECNSLPIELLSSGYVPRQITRLTHGLAALSVALRRRPILRFQRNSPYACRVAAELGNIYCNDLALYDYRSKDTVLLILDRSDDPVTPLLTPWTYQAMLHEHIGLEHNLLRLPEEVENASEEGYAFSEQDDLFFAGNLCHNWGDLCSNIKACVDRCKEALNLDRTTLTMDELRQFMQRMPQTKSLAESVTKHMTVVTHLTNVIKSRDLLHVSLLEQDIVASYSPLEHWKRLEVLIARDDIQSTDKLRLCLLFHMRYEKPDQPSRTALFLDTISSTTPQLLQKLRSYYGRDRLVDRLFADTGIVDTIVKSFVEAGNNYIRHEPVLKRTLQYLLSGRLDSNQYPYLNNPAPPVSSSVDGSTYKPKEVIVFMCGGYTFEEAALVRAINSKTAYKAAQMTSFCSEGREIKVILGGDFTLNSNQFIEHLSRVSQPRLCN
ncbi:unnamed protein product [Phytomonas sp. EM1]|nr:unnamed protein product [Phytomonas sp. EM1]|eukprot:CCW60087.1 unnamed protein product [Phytomonas sp. isolate EM1]